MSARNRDVTLGEPVDLEEAEESVLELRTGVGECWMHVGRICMESCMAYNQHSLPGDSVCLVINSLREIANPKLEILQQQTEVLERLDSTLQLLLRK